jgi:hypothetical protein
MYATQPGSAVDLASKPEAICRLAKNIAVQHALTFMSLKLRITILFVSSLNLIFRAVPSLYPQVELEGQTFALPLLFFDRKYSSHFLAKFIFILSI